MRNKAKDRLLLSTILVIIYLSAITLTLSLGFDKVLQAEASSNQEFTGKVIHGPSAELSCFDCHDKKQPLDTKNIINRCLNCHERFIPDNPMNYRIHAPLFDKGCTKCHEVHSTDKRNLLVAPEQELCLNCHTDLFNRFGPYSHPAKTCSSCHSPHFAQHEYLFIADPVGLCTQPCHDGFQTERSHPLGRNVVDPKTGKEMTCNSSCHVIHSSAYKALTPVSNRKLCKSCHENKY